MAGRTGPSALIEQYENLLISNLGAVQSIESGLRNVSWLLPGRFQDAELASEGCEWLSRPICCSTRRK